MRLKCRTWMCKRTNAFELCGQTIWTGDNLDIMRGLNSESVDLIYLDSPFNSNRDYTSRLVLEGLVRVKKNLLFTRLKASFS